MALSPGPWVKPQYFDNNGDPAASYRLFFYDAGTSTKRDTYQDADQSALNTNPIVLDSAGRANIFLLPTLYKIVYAAAGSDDPPSSPIWTVDDVGPASGSDTNIDVSGTAGETIALNDVVYLSDGSGALTAGRWYLADADQTYSSNAAITLGIATAAIATGDSGSFRRSGRMTGLSGLVAGTVYYVSATAGGMTLTPPTNAIVIGKADSTTSLILDANWGVAGAAVTGLVSATAQIWSGVKTFNSQPLTYIGAATTLPATVGGVFFTDVTQHAAPANSTNLLFSDIGIPANMLNANGKGIRIRVLSNTPSTGTNAHTLNLNVGGTQITILTESAATAFSFDYDIIIIRTSSTTAFMSYIGFTDTSSDAGHTDATNLTGLDFTAAIALNTNATTGATTTLTQDVCIAWAMG